MESEGLSIVIPSAGRASSVKTTKLVSGAVLCVPEFEYAAYKKYNSNTEIITHPNDIIGLANKRQWIYEKFGDVFMLDDDLDAILDLASIGYGMSIKNPNKVRDIIQNMYACAKDAGCYLFGWGNITKPQHFVAHSCSPIRMRGVIFGCNMGLIKGSKLYFNPDIKAANDVWITLLNAYHHRYSWIDMRYCVSSKDTMTRKGGLAKVRSESSEIEDTIKLINAFGNCIKIGGQEKTYGKNPNGRSTKTKYNRVVKFPY